MLLEAHTIQPSKRPFAGHGLADVLDEPSEISRNPSIYPLKLLLKFLFDINHLLGH